MLVTLRLGLGYLNAACVIGAIDQLKKIQIVLFLPGRLSKLGCSRAGQLLLALAHTHRPVGSGVRREEGELNNRQQADTSQRYIENPLPMRKSILRTGLGQAGWAGILVWQIRTKLWFLVQRKGHNSPFAISRDLEIYSAVFIISEGKKIKIMTNLIFLR